MMNKEVNELLDKLGQMEDAPLIWINKKFYTLIEEKQRVIKAYNELASHFYNEQDLRIKLQERIDKAIEYINSEMFDYMETSDLLEILGGKE